MSIPFKVWYKRITSGPVERYYRNFLRMAETAALLQAASATLYRAMSQRGITLLITKNGKFTITKGGKTRKIDLDLFEKALIDLQVPKVIIDAAKIRALKTKKTRSKLEFIPIHAKDKVIKEFILDYDHNKYIKISRSVKEIFQDTKPKRITYTTEIYRDDYCPQSEKSKSSVDRILDDFLKE